jgi:anti-anti-sigma regulatory factor
MQLSIRLVPVGDTTLVVVLTGALDVTTRPVLAAFLDPIPQSAVTYVVVAAGDLWFCDLNGLDQLALTHRALQAKGGHLAVAEAPPPLCRLIALMAQHDTRPAIAVYASMAAALSATDVETYQIDALPTPMPRHLPRVRELHDVHVPVRHPRAAPPRSEPVAPPPIPPPPPSATLPTPIIIRSRALREQAVHHQQAIADRLSTAQQTVRVLREAPYRFLTASWL